MSSTGCRRATARPATSSSSSSWGCWSPTSPRTAGRCGWSASSCTPPTGCGPRSWPSPPTAPVRETREPELREVDLPAGRERWELREGTGHGARLVLVRTGPDTPPAAVTARVEELLAALR